MARNSRQRAGRNASPSRRHAQPTQEEVENLIRIHRSGKTDKALESARRFTRKWPGAVIGWKVLAANREAAGKLEGAAKAYRRALELEPDDVAVHNNLGALLTRLGRPEEAVAAHRRAVTLQPEEPLCHYNLGIALEAYGDRDGARACYERAIQLGANFADAHNRLGNVLRDLELADRAEECYRRALESQPDRAEFYVNLGSLLHDVRRLAEAEHSYRRAVELRPDFAEAYGHLGNVLRRLGRTDEAEKAFRKALELRPDLLGIHDDLGTLLVNLGRFEEALETYRGALRIDPENAVVHYHLAQAKRFTAGSDPDLAALESLLHRGDIPAEHRVYLEYAAGKAYTDRGDDPGHAFEHYLQGARLQRGLLDYDVAEDERLFAAIEEAFDGTGGIFSGDAGHGSEAPIFIVGMPRSGTSLVEQILASHRSVHGAGERHEIWRLVDAMDRAQGRSFPDWIQSLPSDEYAALGRQYCEDVIEPAPGVARVTDKLPHNFLYLGLIRLILPRARVIHVVRDPVDTCVSCFTQFFAGTHSYSYDLEDLGRYYRAYSRLMDHWRRVLPEGFMIDVRYEDVLEDFETEVRRMLDHCGLEWDPACLEFHRTERSVDTVSATQVRSPLYRSSMGRWRPFREHLGPLLDALGPLVSET